MRTRFLVGIASLLCALGFGPPVMASTAIFTGTLYFDAPCVDCSASGGAGTASGAISLANYAWGSDFLDSPGAITGFSYTSQLLGTLSPIHPVINAAGSFAGSASASANLYLEFEIFGGTSPGFYTFQSALSGAWSLQNAFAPEDRGPSHTWSTTPVPEPETYAMLLAGLGLLGFAARRRKQAA